MKISLEELNDLLIKILSSKYYSKEQAEKIAEVLMFSELTGKNTQGIVKLLGTEPIQNVKPQYDPKIVKDTKASVLIDGGGNAAILICQMAVDKLIDKVADTGIAVVGTGNTYSSSGSLGFYTYKLAQKGFISMTFASSPGGVAPFGGLDPLFGTNPLAFGFPTKNDPLIFDMATSAITWYGLVRAKSLGEKIPENVAIDSEGNLTTDPEQAMKGAILPFDRGYKGYGLGLMVEILAGPLVGATFTAPDGGDWGNLFIAIDPGILVGREEFKDKCSELIKIVKNSRIDPKFKKVKVPGEEGLERKKKAENVGMIAIDEKLYNQLRELI